MLTVKVVYKDLLLLIIGVLLLFSHGILLNNEIFYFLGKYSVSSED